MARLTYTPNGGQPIEIGKWAPGFTAEVEGKWGSHQLPGQRGQLMEDLGDGALSMPVQLIFIDPADYDSVIPAISKTRRGKIQHPRRGAKNVVLRRIREEIRWTDRGDATVVDLLFEEATLGRADDFKQGPSVQASAAKEQAQKAHDAAASQTAKVAKRAFSYSVIALRKMLATSSYLIGVAAAGAVSYADAAMLAFAQGLYDPALKQQLRSLPPLVLAAQTALRKTGTAADTYAADIALERMLFACTQLDAAIRAAQPVPIEREVTRPGGQSVYALVASAYPSKSASELRALVTLVLRLNPNLRRPDCIPQGTIVVRPAA
jgi:hypothetical protein